MSSSNIALDESGEEVGFLLLEDCELIFDHRPLERNKWLDVVFRDVDARDQDDVDCCLRGSVVLGSEDIIDGSKQLFLVNSTRFDGTILDVPHSTRCPSCCTLRETNRSDSALILGLAMSCQDQGHIRIETIQVMLRISAEASGQDDDDETSPDRIAFLITFSMPWLVQTKTRGKQKAMPPSTQLLFSLMRSDWEYLSSSMRSDSVQKFQSDGTLRKDSLFPSKLSLEELYSKVRGLQEQQGKKSIRNQASPFSALPLEVIQEKIAPFLGARSLNSWRCTCSELRHALKVIVPGLKLVLYDHQIRSLEWMRERETKAWSEKDILGCQVTPLSFDGDCHRCVTGGATVILRSRGALRKVWRLDTQYGRVYDDFQLKEGSSCLSRKVARGGLLCDDPGLGKTVTVLALILQTLGLSSEEISSPEDQVSKAELSETAIFSAYWREQVDPIYQRQDLNRLTRLARQRDGGNIFLYPVCSQAYPDYYDVIERPMCFRLILKNIDADKYADDFSAYEKDVELIFQNAIHYNGEDGEISDLARAMWVDFNHLVSELKTRKIQSAKKSFSNAHTRPNSSVAAILEQKNRKKFIDSLVPSAANLVVVPETLLSHWVDQFTMHVDLRYCTTREPVVFHFKARDGETKERLKELMRNSSVSKTQSPWIFVDHSGTLPLPGPDLLAIFTVVLTTTKRFTHEWKKGSFEEEVKQNDGSINPYAFYRTDRPKSGACPLLKVHWTRMIIDEGHSMGRAKRSNAILFASWICANRRWSMTGTPTPQTASHSGLSNLLGLMAFLKHEFFTARFDGDRMWALLSRSWNSGSLAPFFQLRSLLAILMIRHTKLDIAELPPPIFERVWLDMSRDEQTTFNTLVCAIQSNIILTTMKGDTSGLQDSLLHRSQAKYARLAFDNLRLACSGGLRVVPQITPKAWAETLFLLDEHQLEKAKKKVVVDYMQRAVTEQLSHCMVCGFEVSTLLVLTCGDLICTDCVTSKTESCSVCNQKFKVDDVQRLQPGIVYEWYDYRKQEEHTKAQLLSIQDDATPSVHLLNGGEAHIDLAGHVALQPHEETRRTKKRGDGHECEYSIAAANGKCILCHEEHDDCIMIAEGSQCFVCHRVSQNCPREETKFHHVIAEMDRLHTRANDKTKVFSPAAANFAGEKIELTEDRPLKVIIFSQFRKVLNLIGHRLIRRYGAGAVAEFWGSYRRQELEKFKTTKDCFCMLLSKDGSEGLDLSFITHIFFLEEIWDKSLQDQAVARAWRMGAKGRVHVETLLAKDSVESLITDAEQKLASGNLDKHEQDSISDIMRSKMLHILGNLRLMGRSDQLKKRKSECANKSKKKPRVRFHD